MRLAEVMTPSVEIVPPDMPVAEAAARLRDLDRDVLPVGDGGRVVGLLVGRDIVERATARGHDPRTAPVREVIFAREAAKGPLRLYFGNANAAAPHYDFAAHLPARLDPTPARTAAEDVTQNPDYQPAPKPLTERWPWLVYVVLSAASVVLLIILAALAHRALPQPEAEVR